MPVRPLARCSQKTVGRRYVRLDRTIEGFARLSPSILRKFMTYTIVGLASDADAVDEVARRLHARITVINRNKHRLSTGSSRMPSGH